ncbi:hypothetical protein TRIP_C21049 [Candidatus Zixiibacteriota bacterium]|nr:hypothetical protein TRIP_C21049 [candidate division Zixibacteria bacterium]
MSGGAPSGSAIIILKISEEDEGSAIRIVDDWTVRDELRDLPGASARDQSVCRVPSYQ